MTRTIRGILFGLSFAALIGSGEAAVANAVTPFERAAYTPRGQLHSPYADFASVAKEGHKIYLSHDCNGCHGGGGGGMAHPSPTKFGFTGTTTTRCFA
jgi:mono/diheme cytochrome c family protein